MRFFCVLIFSILLINVSLAEDEKETHQAFLERIIKECVIEIGVDPAIAQKTLLGDMSDTSEKVKVK